MLFLNIMAEKGGGAVKGKSCCLWERSHSRRRVAKYFSLQIVGEYLILQTTCNCGKKEKLEEDKEGKEEEKK